MILGEKIRLRALESGDVETLRKWRNHPELFGYHFSTMPVSDIEQKRWYEGYSSGSKTVAFMIEDENGTPVGYTLIKDLDHKNRNAEIGLHLDPDFQGKGYGKDAFKTLMKFCFHELNLHRLFLQVFEFNERALAMYKKLGFHVEGTKRDAFFTQNRFHTIVMMSILDSEFSV